MTFDVYSKKGILAVYTIRKIRENRAEIAKEDDVPHHRSSASTEFLQAQEIAKLEELRQGSVAYIVRQFKRPEEIQLMRKTYGSAFIQISVTQNRQGRISNLKERLSRENSNWEQDKCDAEARKIIRHDENENDDNYGQRLTKIFHLADVFIEANDESHTLATCVRFINALFWRKNIIPTRDDFGSYLAKSASLRSVDLSRQVGLPFLTATVT